MDEDEYRAETLKLEKRRFQLEREKFELENTFFKKHFGAILTVFASLVVATLGYVQVITSNTEAEAAVKSARLNREAELAKVMEVDSDLINSIGTVSRTNKTPDCNPVDPIPLLSDGSLRIGLDSTHLGGKIGGTSAQVQLFTPNMEYKVRLGVGEVTVIQFDDRKFNLSISFVSECTADYRIWELTQPRGAS